MDPFWERRRRNMLRLTANDVKDKSLFIGTPMYASKCHGKYLYSVLSLVDLCNRVGIRTVFSSICNESLVQRSRNYIVDEFLRSQFSHMIFLDTDIEFPPEYVLTLLLSGKDLIGAPYPNKTIDWEQVRNVVLSGHDKNLASVAGERTHHGGWGDVVETNVLTTGFMLIGRDMLERLIVAYPEYSYKPDHLGLANFNGKRRIQLFFSSEIDPDTNVLVSEYEFFCRLWRKIGGKIYVCPWMVLNHIGHHKF